jgi:hypothetical protein
LLFLGRASGRKKRRNELVGFEARAAELLGGRFFHPAIEITGKVLGSCPTGGDE